jgi:hypothetical protein
MPQKKPSDQYRTLDFHVRTGTQLALRDGARVSWINRSVATRRVVRTVERNFVEALSNFVIIIGGLADPVINLTRGLTIWSVLVLGAGASSMVLIRAYMGGLLDEAMMFAGVFTTLLISMLIGLRVTTAARRAQIEIMRMPLPGWMTEEG